MTSILQLHHQRPDGEVDSYNLKAGRRYHLGRGSQCQVRILDLKLSRQHCAFEHVEHGWTLVDLASTNGCSLDGTRVTGSLRVHPGSIIVAGSTTVLVKRVFDSSEDHPEPNDVSKTSSSVALFPYPSQGRGEPIRVATDRSSSSTDDLQPQTAPNRVKMSDPLIPGGPHTEVDHDILATLTPGTRAPIEMNPDDDTAADDGSDAIHLHLLGRRIGPLTKAQAKDLKTREISGTLVPADLAPFEPSAPPSASASATSSSDDLATYYITLLGQRVGPMTRNQARELKTRELRGDLLAAEVQQMMVR